jgi:excisionase family DNA binding protein
MDADLCPMLTADEVARILGLKRRTVYDLAASGKLPSYRPAPGAVRFDAADVASFKAASSPLAPRLPTARELRELERLRLRIPEPERPASMLTREELEIAYRRRRNVRMVPWADGNAIRAIYAEAKRISAETGIPHHVDHIIPLQGEFVSGLHVETNLRIVTRSENLKKRNKIEHEP